MFQNLYIKNTKFKQYFDPLLLKVAFSEHNDFHFTPNCHQNSSVTIKKKAMSFKYANRIRGEPPFPHGERGAHPVELPILYSNELRGFKLVGKAQGRYS